MLDFSFLPPEINSTLMYCGPGASPWISAASSWKDIATQLWLSATGLRSTLDELTTSFWHGPSSTLMLNLAVKYQEWLTRMSLIAEDISHHIYHAANSYQCAFTATIPPEEVMANRVLLHTLIATNFFGQNTPAIALTEARYAHMWVQDAIAMHTYYLTTLDSRHPIAFPNLPPHPHHLQPSPNFLSTSPVSPTYVAEQVATSPGTWLGLLDHVPNMVNAVVSPNSAGASGKSIYSANWRAAARAAREAQQQLTRLRLVSQQSSLTTRALLGRATSINQLSVPQSWTLVRDQHTAHLVHTSHPSASHSTAHQEGETSESLSNAISQVLATAMIQTDRPMPAKKHRSKPILVRSPAAG